GYGDECKANLEQLIGHEEEGGNVNDSGDFEGLDFTPVRFDEEPSDTGAGERSFSIGFRPRTEMLASQDPLFLLQQLRELGTLGLPADTGRLPQLADLVPGESYIGWTATLRTTWGREDVERVFAFAADKCDLEVVDLDPPAAAIDPMADLALAAEAVPPE